MDRYLSPGAKALSKVRANLSIEEQDSGCDGFDEFMGKRWIYPNNREVRPYQMAAVTMALFHNAMIVLPTGFGKTFIAAVVMYNFYRFYPRGKLIFVAPTRPLVNQQIEECTNVSGIPRKDCIVMTGNVPQSKRHGHWHEKRVFFATPQVIQNDLNDSIAPARDIKCIVIDEAHRAQGNFAYVEIIKLLQAQNKNGYRVLALSATPGSDMEKVKQVITNLLISDVMFKSESDLHLSKYKNAKISKAYHAVLVGRHREIADKFVEITKPIFMELMKAGLIYSCDSIERASTFVLMQASKRLASNQVENLNPGRKGKLNYYCFAAMSLTHTWQLLINYGLRPFYNSLKKTIEEKPSVRSVLIANPKVDILMRDIETMFGCDLSIEPNGPPPTHDLLKGHPKLEILQSLLMIHFNEKEHEERETRAIVFTKYCDSVLDIVQTLRVYEPILKPVAFVGQKSLSQKQQLTTLAQFKNGVYNVLVATCVAEEGLDIGELDLCICYDVAASLISSTQRRGRTGRKRTGDIVTLVTKGYEDKKLSRAGADKRQIESQLYDKNHYIRCLYDRAPRMVPHNITPECELQMVFPVIDEETLTKKDKKPAAKRRKKDDTSLEEDDLSNSIKKQKRSGKKGSLKKDSAKKASATKASAKVRVDVEDEWLSDDGSIMGQLLRDESMRKESQQKSTEDNGFHDDDDTDIDEQMGQSQQSNEAKQDHNNDDVDEEPWDDEWFEQNKIM